MGRQVYIPESASKYLECFASKKAVVLGLVLGEISPNNDEIINVVHLAKTPEERIDSPCESEEEGNEVKLNLKDVSESLVADHAKHVTRMLPGGMFVLGVFVVTSEDVFSDSTISKKLKNIVLYVNKILSVNKYMFGCPIHSDERVIIHMSSETKKITVKSLEIADGGFFKPVNQSSTKYSPTWIEFECYYEFDEFYPVVVKNTGISVKEQCQIILSTSLKSIESSVVLFDGNLRVSSDTLESQFKKKKNRNQTKSSSDDESTTVQVSIMVPCESSVPDNVEYMECEGTTHFSGIIASRVFLISKSTIEEAVNAVKQDIMRSLAARFTMHCDALIDDNLLPEEKVCFNEPPRRVYIKIPQMSNSKVLLCDYLFPGESPVEALVSVKEMLDVDISEEDVISNVETPADTSEFDALERDPGSEEMLTTPQDVNKITFPVGVGISVLIALISILIYYYVTISNVKTTS